MDKVEIRSYDLDARASTRSAAVPSAFGNGGRAREAFGKEVFASLRQGGLSTR